MAWRMWLWNSSASSTSVRLNFAQFDVDGGAEFGRDFGVEAGVEQQDAGVDEVGLAFEKAGAHGGHQAVGTEEEQRRCR